MDDARKEKLVKELQGMAIGAVGIFLLMALFTFSSADQSLNSWSTASGVQNLGGRLGAQVADLLLMLFGLASYLLPGVLLLIAYNLLRFKEPRLRLYKSVAFGGLLVSLAALFAFNLEVTTLLGQQVPTGGAIGALLVRLLKTTVGTVGALLVLLPLLAASVMVLSGFSFVLFASWWLENLRHKWAARQERQAFKREEQQKEKARTEGRPLPASGPVIKPAAPPHRPPSQPLPQGKEEGRGGQGKTGTGILRFHQERRRLPYPAAVAAGPAPGHGAPYRTGPAGDERPAAGKEAAGFRHRRRGEGDLSRPGDHHVRVRPGAGDQDQPHRRPLRRPDHGAAGPLHPDRGADPRQGGGGHRGTQPGAGNGFSAGNLHLRGVPAEPDEAPPGAGQGYRRAAADHRSGQGAPPAGGRLHRLRQVGLGQHHDPVAALHRHPPRCAFHHGGPQDAGVLHVRGDSPPAAAGGDGAEEGFPGPEMGGERDGAPLPPAGGQGGAQHRILQPQAGRRGGRAGRQRRLRRGDHRGTGRDRGGG
ncbi:membrane protein of unknown function [Trichlorobacter ammonificans]|uniref:DNA translocase FtsK 4TM region domain-containing protein n=1 Tax=Trichlorobacter ammonificans TaxID=2916410 RepID=A0ABN8HBW5_9BACT|nr:membrane protein of unknown function [Trichlorobacter ammonificans]